LSSVDIKSLVAETGNTSIHCSRIKSPLHDQCNEVSELSPEKSELAGREHADFAKFMAAMRESDPVWQDRVVTAFTSSVSTRDWALLTSSESAQD
jgi:hypothetical protein